MIVNDQERASVWLQRNSTKEFLIVMEILYIMKVEVVRQIYT